MLNEQQKTWVLSQTVNELIASGLKMIKQGRIDSSKFREMLDYWQREHKHDRFKKTDIYGVQD